MVDKSLDVTDVGSIIRKFIWPDYLVFLAMLLICIVIGMYYAFQKKSPDAQDYLMGGRNMATVPVAMSLIARCQQLIKKKKFITNLGISVILAVFLCWESPPRFTFMVSSMPILSVDFY